MLKKIWKSEKQISDNLNKCKMCIQHHCPTVFDYAYNHYNHLYILTSVFYVIGVVLSYCFRCLKVNCRVKPGCSSFSLYR